MTNTSPHAVDAGYEPWARSAVARRDIPVTYEMASELLASLDKARARVAELETALDSTVPALDRLGDEMERVLRGIPERNPVHITAQRAAGKLDAIRRELGRA